MSLGSTQLASWLERSHLTQREGAVALGIHYTYLNQLLSGRRKPGRDLAVRIAEQTGIAVGAWATTRVGKSAKRVLQNGAKVLVGKVKTHAQTT